MKQIFRSFLMLSLLSVGFLSASCNKDKNDEPAPDPETVPSEITGGTGKPDSTTAKYYTEKDSRILYRRSGDVWKALTSLPELKQNSKVYVAQGLLSNKVGSDGDYYINDKTGAVFHKVNGAWTANPDDIYIPDENFRRALITVANNGSPIDNIEGRISKATAQTIQSIRVPNQSIRSLEGIQFFTNLTVLEASNNRIANINLDDLTRITNLTLTGNQFSGVLDISKLTRLTPSQVHIVSGNNGLTKIKVANDALASSLNISENTNKYTATEAVDELIDLDPILLAAIIDKATGTIDINGDERISVSEAKAYTGPIVARTPGIRSLQGLEFFEKVTSIEIDPGTGNTNTLSAGKTKLSLTGLTQLARLTVTNTTLDELELKNLPALTTVSVVNNNLTKVSFTALPALTTLSLERNELATVDDLFTQLTHLTSVNLMGNKLTGELDLTNMESNLLTNAGGFQIMRICAHCPRQRGNELVTKIIVNTPAEASALNAAEGTVVYQSKNSGGEDNTLINIPDLQFRTLLLRLLQAKDRIAYRNRTVDGPFTQSDVDLVEKLRLDNNVRDIRGLEYFRKLNELTIYAQGPTSLDLSGLRELEKLNLDGGTIETVTGTGVKLKDVVLTNALNIRKLNLINFRNIETLIINEDSNQPNHIECISVPANKVENIKAGINFLGIAGASKTAFYRSKVQSSTCP